VKTVLLAALLCTLVAPASAQQIALTFDDLPSHSTLPPGTTRVEIAEQIIAALKDAKTPPVYGFVNGIRLEDDPLSAPVLKLWRDAGFPLGNHTWSHMNVNQNSLADWEADVLKNEPLLKSYMEGHDWHWLRFPYLAEGNTPEKREGVRRFLAQHGYKIADVTMSFGDYMYNEPYARCVAKNDPAAIAQLETSYLAAAASTIDYTREMSKALYGRDIPYVLLMHVGALDARLLPRLLKLYQDKGFTFITLQDAEKDPFYKADVDLTLPAGANSLEGEMHAHNLPMPPHQRPTVNLNTICR